MTCANGLLLQQTYHAQYVRAHWRLPLARIDPAAPASHLTFPDKHVSQNLIFEDSSRRCCDQCRGLLRCP
jgi:hypothetical protein